MYTILLVTHSIIVLFLIIMVLIQRTGGDGLSGLGGGGNQFMTGRATANLMTRTTAILAGAFMVTSLVLAVMGGRMNSGSIIDAVPAAEQSAPLEAPKDHVAAPHEMKKEKPAAPAVPKGE